MNDKTYDLLVKCELQLDDAAELIKHYAVLDQQKRGGKAISDATIELIKERRRMMNLSKKIAAHLTERQAA